MKITYTEKNGKLYFECEEDVTLSPQRTWTYTYLQEELPDFIITKGKIEIIAYIKDKIQKLNARLAYQANTNFFISVQYDGVVLEGKIVSAKDGYLFVRLEVPYKGETGISYGFASAMAGHYIFSENGAFTENALKTAQTLLIAIYKKQKHYAENKYVIDLKNKLNKE